MLFKLLSHTVRCYGYYAEADRKPVDAGGAVERAQFIIVSPLSLSLSNWAHWISPSGGCLATSINSDM